MVEWLVIDDGSSDRTSDVARAHGVHRVVRSPSGRASPAPSRRSPRGAGDGRRRHRQHRRRQPVPRRRCRPLVQPILAVRPTWSWAPGRSRTSSTSRRSRSSCSGSGATWCGRLSSTDVPDATSGFRAFDRDAALRLTVLTNFSHTSRPSSRPTRRTSRSRTCRCARTEAAGVPSGREHGHLRPALARQGCSAFGCSTSRSASSSHRGRLPRRGVGPVPALLRHLARQSHRRRATCSP